ncbi:LLM class flavin-dependent oxidoreductase [Rhodococcus wratislaviensis]|uniref:LLM class flavin-dependent oxidoreductase n=1 Tax=Rhodococcus wratislaviensis TaxID=44752 RepID=UPI00366027C8
MNMELSCTFATTLSTPENIRIAEELGYVSAWPFYSPAIYADPWMMLALAAERTSRIGLGISVIVPRLRHVADVASSLATLYQLAPDRVTLVVGSGFSSTGLLRSKNIPWSVVETFVDQLRTLLAGGEIEIDGRKGSMLHAAESGISLPIDVPIWVAAHGPKGLGVASRVANGIITNLTHGDQKITFEGPCAVSYYGTVLAPNETCDDPAVIERVAPAAALALHMGPYGPLAGSAEERGFTAAIESFPEDERVIETHRGHMLTLTELDRKYVNGNAVRDGTLTGSPAQIRDRLAEIEQSGVTRFCYTPVGPDIPRELEAFARVFHA